MNHQNLRLEKYWKLFRGTLSLEDIKQDHDLNLTYLNACWIMQMRYHRQKST